MNKYFEELVQAMRDLYFKDGERILFDGYYKIASFNEEGDWQYVIYYLTEDDEWENFEDGAGYFCYYDSYTKETTSLQDIAEKWIVPFIFEDLKKQVEE
jgi:hypothetical protein